jgi:tetratricopeptide (TPR) repeat protein
VAVAVIVAIAGFLLVPRDAAKTLRKNVVDGIWMIGLGGLAVLLAGWPFWLIGFTPSLNWPASRFTLPFMLGVALIFAGFISLIPWEKLRIVLLVSLVSMAAGKQYLTSHDYLQDWETQKNLFWQMTWRAPSIAPDTLLLVNEGAFDFYADNSLSAALNWIYAPDNHSSHIEYVLFHPTTRFKNALPDIETEIPIYYDYLAGEFNGNTSKTLSFYYAPPGCLRLLDPQVERVNRLIPENSLMRYAARLTDPKLILEEPRAVMPAVYGPEPEHGFCYYYQKADLARQFKRWDEAAGFIDTALSFEEHPYEPAEHLLFIEGYAHVGQWERALDLSEDAYEFSPEFMGRVICQLWERIGAETGESPERSEAFTKVQSMFACSP